MCVKMIKRHSLHIITIRTKSTHREEIDFSCKQTNETNEFYLGSLAILGHEVVPTSLIVKKRYGPYFAKRSAYYMLAGLFDDVCGSVVDILRSPLCSLHINVNKTVYGYCCKKQTNK